MTQESFEQDVDFTYRYFDSPFGSMLIAATPLGVVRVALEAEDHPAVLTQLANTMGPRMQESGAGTDEAIRQLEDYFACRRQSFDLPLDLRLVDGFRREVITQLSEIAYGATATYSEVAAAAGNPRAVRAVGSACSHNPVPVLVPCHRVVRSDGSMGDYLGGTDMKKALLELEAKCIQPQ